MIQVPRKTFLTLTLSSFLAVGCGSSSSTSSTTTDTGSGGSGEPKAGSITLGNYQSVLDAGFGGFGHFSESSDAFTASIDGSTTTDDVFDITSCDTGSVTPSETLTSRTAGFDNCMVDSSRYDGSISANVDSLSGGFLLDEPAGDGEIGATFTFTNFTAAANDVAINNMLGSVAFSVELSGGNETIGVSSSGLSFDVINGSGTGATSRFEMTSLELQFTGDGATGEDIDTLDFSYKQVLDGKEVTITYNTTVPFRTAENELNPRYNIHNVYTFSHEHT